MIINGVIIQWRDEQFFCYEMNNEIDAEELFREIFGQVGHELALTVNRVLESRESMNNLKWLKNLLQKQNPCKRWKILSQKAFGEVIKDEAMIVR